MKAEGVLDGFGEVFVTREGINDRVSVYDTRTGRCTAHFTAVPKYGVMTTLAVTTTTGEGGGDGSRGGHGGRAPRAQKRARRRSLMEDGLTAGKEESGGEKAVEVAVGYSTGAVSFLSTVTVDAVHAEEDGHLNSPILALVFTSDASVVYSTAEDRALSSWKTTSGKRILHKKNIDRSAPTCLALSPDEKILAVAASHIVLFDPNTFQPLRQLVGHVSPVSAMVFASSTELFSGCGADRHVARWNLESEAKTADGSFLATSPVVSLAVNATTGLLAAVGSDQVLTVFRTSSTPKEAPATTIKSHILGAALPRGQRITVVYGSKNRPTFDSFDLDRGDEIIELEETERDRKGGREGSTAQSDAKRIVDNEHTVKVLSGGVDDERKGRTGGEDDDKDEDDDKEEDVNGEGVEDGDTIEEKLAKLGVVSAKEAKTAAEEEEEEGIEEEGMERDGQGVASVAAILSQALETKDGALLEEALFSVNKRSAVRSTVEKLPVEMVAPLVTALSVRMQSKPRRVSSLAVWLRALLTEHASVLSNSHNRQVLSALSGLYQSVEERVRMHKRMAMLEGRLELVLMQAQRVSKTVTNTEDQEPLFEFTAADELMAEETLQAATIDDDSDDAMSDSSDDDDEDTDQEAEEEDMEEP